MCGMWTGRSHSSFLSQTAHRKHGFLVSSAAAGQVVEEGTQTTPSTKPSLIGTCPEVIVIAGGKNIPCILDTGSQVTLFSYSLFQQHFGEGLVRGEIPWLTLKAANGLSIPYVGYALLDFEINGVKVMGKGVVVVEDSCFNSKNGILGMNIIGDCWRSIFQDGHTGEAAFSSMLPKL